MNILNKIAKLISISLTLFTIFTSQVLSKSASSNLNLQGVVSENVGLTSSFNKRSGWKLTGTSISNHPYLVSYRKGSQHKIKSQFFKNGRMIASLSPLELRSRKSKDPYIVSVIAL